MVYRGFGIKITPRVVTGNEGSYVYTYDAKGKYGTFEEEVYEGFGSTPEIALANLKSSIDEILAAKADCAFLLTTEGQVQ